MRRWLGRGRTVLVDSTDGEAMGRYPQVNRAAARQQMYILSPEGELAGGYDGVVMIVGAMGGAGLVVWGMRLAWIRRPGWAVYRWIARHRSCAGGACSIG